MDFSISRFVAFALLVAAMIASTGFTNSGARPHDYRDKNFDYFVVGDPTRPRASHTDFELALMGGGGIVESAYASIAIHAGRGHIVILRAVADDSFDPEDGDLGKNYAAQWGPVVSAETIVFHHREAAFDPRVIAALRAADGIFLAGGDQGNYIRYWKGTPVQEALNAHVRANRPIGGSSAGLAILGHYSYTSLDGGSMESSIAFRNPYDSGVTLENDFLHLRWLDNVITDTHFSARCRLGRLIVFLARINKDQAEAAQTGAVHTEPVRSGSLQTGSVQTGSIQTGSIQTGTFPPGSKVFGIGLDEKTALLIGPDGVGRLAPGSAGSAWVVMPQQPATILAGEPLTMQAIRIIRMDLSSDIDLKSRHVSQPAAETIDSIQHGAPTQNSFATPIMMRAVVPPDES